MYDLNICDWCFRFDWRAACACEIHLSKRGKLSYPSSHHKR